MRNYHFKVILHNQMDLCIRRPKTGGAIIRAGAIIGTNTVFAACILLVHSWKGLHFTLIKCLLILKIYCTPLINFKNRLRVLHFACMQQNLPHNQFSWAIQDSRVSNELSRLSPHVGLIPILRIIMKMKYQFYPFFRG